jgi:hypothetical protein
MHLKIFPERKERKLMIGRLSPIDVEIEDPVTKYYYFGKVEMFDTEAKLENEEKPIKIFFYRTLANHREDQKIIVSTDDFIANAEQVPYTRTRKGKTSLLMIVFMTYFAIEMLTIYLSYLFIQAGPNIVYYPQVVNSLIWNFGTIAFLFAAVAGIWAWSARYHHFVSDWEIQPLIVDAEKSNTDFFILTNSNKLPVSETIQRLLKLTPNNIKELVHEVRLFRDTIIRTLTDQANAMRKDNNAIDIIGFATHKKALETALATREQRFVEKLDSIKWVALTISVSISFGFAIYLAMGGRL